MKAIQQLLDIIVAFEIDVGVGVAVAGQELLDAQRAGGMHRPDEDDVAESLRDQLGAAQEERPHQDLAELGVGLHQREQVGAGQLDDGTRHGRPHPNQRPAARQHVGLAGELAGAEQRDQRVTGR